MTSAQRATCDGAWMGGPRTVAVIEGIEADSDDLVEACDGRVRCTDAETRMIPSCTSSSYAKTGAGRLAGRVPRPCSVGYRTQVWRGDESRRT